MVSGHTHVCTTCWRRLVVTRDWQRAGAFITTVPNAHNRKYHADTDEGKESQGRVDASGQRKTGALLFAGSSSAGAPPPPPSMASFYVPPAEKALAFAARFYIYGKGHVSKETFDDPEFRGMLQAYYEAGGGVGKAPVLTTKGLKAWVDAEYDVFRSFARFSIEHLLEYSMGYPPGQGLHDCVTLDNKEKYMSSGYEFIPPDLSRNLVVCTGMRKINGGDDATGVAMLDTSFIDVFAHTYKQCSNTRRSSSRFSRTTASWGSRSTGWGSRLRSTSGSSRRRTGSSTTSWSCGTWTWARS